MISVEQLMISNKWYIRSIANLPSSNRATDSSHLHLDWASCRQEPLLQYRHSKIWITFTTHKNVKADKLRFWPSVNWLMWFGQNDCTAYSATCKRMEITEQHSGPCCYTAISHYFFDFFERSMMAASIKVNQQVFSCIWDTILDYKSDHNNFLPLDPGWRQHRRPFNLMEGIAALAFLLRQFW